MKRALFIYNPNSGKGLLKPKLADIIDIMVKAGYEVVVYPTQCYRDAYHKVATFTESYDRVICSGGDGTLDEVVTGMMEREQKIPIGYIPTGTMNDFASSMYIPKNLLLAAEVAVGGSEFAFDIGKFNEGVFVYVAAFGIFTDVSYETKQELKNIFGQLAYVLEGVTKLFDIPSFKMKITYGDQVIEDEFILGMVTNSRSVGGMRNLIKGKVVFDDGEFEVTLIKTPKNPIALQEIIAALTIGQFDTKYMYSFKTDHITFEAQEEVPWTLDGEYGGGHRMVDIRNHQKALTIVVPEEYVKDVSEAGEKAVVGRQKLVIEKLVEGVVTEIKGQVKKAEDKLIDKKDDQ